MIIKRSIQETTGNKFNVAQSFKQNIFYNVSEAIVNPSIFNTPKYTTIGGTIDYYGQNPNAIFTSLVKPFIRFNFTANTESFGPNVYIKHDIYRVSWDIFKEAQKEFKVDMQDEIETLKESSEIIEEMDEITGNIISRKKITRVSSEKNNTLRYLKNEDEFDKKNSIEYPNPPASKEDLLNIIKEQLINPIYSITGATSGITNFTYDLQIEQYIKNLGNFKTELFQDKNQYIIDTNFIFDINLTTGLTDLQIITENGLENNVYNSTIKGETSSEIGAIEFGDFSGITFKKGEFFSFFQVPDKPNFEYPTPVGQINTFTPEIFWSNGEGADSFLAQVTYNTGDTGFTGTVFTYIIPKVNEYKEKAQSKIKDTTEDFSSDKTIRKFQLPLKSNKCALYRIGNVKELINIFGVRQSVVTFSESLQICTQKEPINSFVYSESDSPYIIDISGLQNSPSLEFEDPLGEYILSGQVSGSTITGATMQLIYPNSSFVTTSTNIIGEFLFDSLEPGNYTLNTNYRGYSMDSRIIEITGDTNVFIELQVMWDNIFDIWETKENDIIKY